MRIRAFHSTSVSKAEIIIRTGKFRLPTSTDESSTDSAIGIYYPAVFFARDPVNADYGPILFEVELDGTFMKWLPARRNESLSERLIRSLDAAKAKGKDGVDPNYDTVGIAVINPSVIKILSVTD